MHVHICSSDRPLPQTLFCICFKNISHAHSTRPLTLLSAHAACVGDPLWGVSEWVSECSESCLVLVVSADWWGEFGEVFVTVSVVFAFQWVCVCMRSLSLSVSLSLSLTRFSIGPRRRPTTTTSMQTSRTAHKTRRQWERTRFAWAHRPRRS